MDRVQTKPVPRVEPVCGVLCPRNNVAGDEQLGHCQARDTTAELISRYNAATKEALVHANANGGLPFDAFNRQIPCLDVRDFFDGFAQPFRQQALAFVSERFRALRNQERPIASPPRGDARGMRIGEHLPVRRDHGQAVDAGSGDDEPVGGVLVLPFGKAGGLDGDLGTDLRSARPGSAAAPSGTNPAEASLLQRHPETKLALGFLPGDLKQADRGGVDDALGVEQLAHRRLQQFGGGESVDPCAGVEQVGVPAMIFNFPSLRDRTRERRDRSRGRNGPFPCRRIKRVG